MTLPHAPTLPERFRCWPALQAQRERYHQLTLPALFDANPERSRDCSITAAGIHFDYSRQFIDAATREALIQLADEAGLPAAIGALLNGEAVNNTEHRPALHTALRDPDSHIPDAASVHRTYERMAALVEAVSNGYWRGHDDQTITDVVNIGIGGSDLGPQMATHALRPFHTGALRTHFVSNVDPSCLQDLLTWLDPARTLFIVASKSFTTLETLQNAEAAKRWLLEATGKPEAIARHFVAVSTAVQRAQAFGICADNIFPMWDWVGGRYSLWSAIGLPIAFAAGMPVFQRMLQGAAAMDKHFATAPLAHNMPVLAGLIGFWNQHFWDAHSHVILPYDHYLRYFPDYLQQLDMESNGKHVTRQGEQLPYRSGPIIWGSVGTNGQHSFHQLLHQGTHCIPADFIITLQSHHPACAEQHRHLLANALAQSQALMYGKQEPQVRAELQAQGLDAASIDALWPHKHVPGNRQSTVIALDLLTPETLGALIALYEHKVYVQSVLWNINAFDQWGVELGKQLSGPIFNSLQDNTATAQEPATQALIDRYHVAQPVKL